jgi:hypothetical protein
MKPNLDSESFWQIMKQPVYYDQSKSTGMNFFVLKSNTIYCSIIFTNCIESTTFIQFIYKVN